MMTYEDHVEMAITRRAKRRKPNPREYDDQMIPDDQPSRKYGRYNSFTDLVINMAETGALMGCFFVLAHSWTSLFGAMSCRLFGPVDQLKNDPHAAGSKAIAVTVIVALIVRVAGLHDHPVVKAGLDAPPMNAALAI